MAGSHSTLDASNLRHPRQRSVNCPLNAAKGDVIKV